MDRPEFLWGLHLNAKMIDSLFPPALADREIDARVVQHPLGVIRFEDRRLGGEQRRIETDRSFEIVDGDMDMQSFHRMLLASRCALACAAGLDKIDISIIIEL
jgi:hypothetical protein